MFPAVEQIYRSHLPHCKTSEESKWICDFLREAEHVEIDWPIYQYARALADDYAISAPRDPEGGMKSPDAGRLFCVKMAVTLSVPKNTVVHYNGEDHEVPENSDVAMLFMRAGDGVKRIAISDADHLLQNNSHLMLFSGWVPGENGFADHVLNYFPDLPFERLVSQTLADAFLCAVLSQERFVVRHPGGSRQQKRRLQRELGFAPIGWHRVTWNIGEAVKAKVSTSDPKNAMPLHFCRAHWRKAIVGQPKAIKRNDRPGWWCWVSECWKGHPAFGLKLHHYTPKLRDGAALPTQPFGAKAPPQRPAQIPTADHVPSRPTL